MGVAESEPAFWCIYSVYTLGVGGGGRGTEGSCQRPHASSSVMVGSLASYARR